MIRLSGKTGEVFCAAPCTFSPTKGTYKTSPQNFVTGGVAQAPGLK